MSLFPHTKNEFEPSPESNLVMQKSPIPEPFQEKFIGSIAHPKLYLWDAWSYVEGKDIHLYCLAVSRVDRSGRALNPTLRNDHSFHVRHFISLDNGSSWQDAGCFMRPGVAQDGSDENQIWSGSITLLNDGRKLFAYTGLRVIEKSQPFQQSIGIAISNDGMKIDQVAKKALSSSWRDWQVIREKNYYLGDKVTLGHKDGEEGGPILSWRDPFVINHDGQLHMFWAAKVSPKQPALAHATITEKDSEFVIQELFEPVVMPDASDFTQLELPKVLFDDVRNQFYLVIASCNRIYEGQSDAEVDKQIRIYRSESLFGPWQAAGVSGSYMFEEIDGRFALTVLSADFNARELTCISPYTEAVEPERQLTLSKPFKVKLND